MFDNWAECEESVLGFSGSEYKGFKTKEGAQALLAQEQQKLVQKIDAEEAEITEDPEPEPEKKKGFWSRIFRGN